MTPFCDVDNPTICLSAGLLGRSLGRRECGDGVGGPSEKGAEQPHAASRSCHRGGAGGGGACGMLAAKHSDETHRSLMAGCPLP